MNKAEKFCRLNEINVIVGNKPQVEYPAGLQHRLKDELDMIMRVVKDELQRADEIIKILDKMEKYSKKMKEGI